MPGYIAKKLCPELILIPPHFDKYELVAKEIRSVLGKYDPNFKYDYAILNHRTVSLDEAYLDLTFFVQDSQKTVQDIAFQIREEIFE